MLNTIYDILGIIIGILATIVLVDETVIKIKNKTKINYDLEKIANETTLKGLFAKEMLQKLNNENISNEEKEIIEKAVEIGMEALGI